MAGEQGNQGDQGTQGTQGNQGDQGAQGNQGAQGGGTPSNANPFVNPDGTFKEGFKEHLPEELQGDKSVDKFKDISSVFASYKSLEQRLGKKGFTIPDEHSSDEEKAAFREAVGLVDDPESLELPEPENMPEGYEYSEDFTSKFKQAMIDSGVPKEAANKLWQTFHEWSGNAVEDVNKQTEEQRVRAADELRKEWGRDYESNVQRAKRALSERGFLEQVQANGLADNPLVVKLGHELYNAIGEATLGEPSAPTRGDAKSQISQVRSDPKHPFNDVSHPQHREAVQRMDTLYEQAYGS